MDRPIYPESFVQHAIDMVPADHMKGAVERYLRHGISGGDFLTAVLANDLKGAAGRADSTNAELLREWAAWLYNDCPIDAQGSYDKVEAWCKSGGVTGRLGSASAGRSQLVETQDA